ILINFNIKNRKINLNSPGRESNPVSFGCALKALPVKLSETSSGLIVILIIFNIKNRKINLNSLGRESNPVSFGCALRTLPVRLSETL
ncbi:Protein of unknown function, partial [Cotesia congregata]